MVGELAGFAITDSIGKTDHCSMSGRTALLHFTGRAAFHWQWSKAGSFSIIICRWSRSTIEALDHLSCLPSQESLVCSSGSIAKRMLAVGTERAFEHVRFDGQYSAVERNEVRDTAR